MIKKTKVEIEHELRSKSQNIIWKLISTPEGMGKWLADKITQAGNKLTFTWGHDGKDRETKNAIVTEKVKNKTVRFHWEGEEHDDDGYVELRIEKNAVTNDYALHITDFAQADDVDWLYNIWNGNIQRLHLSSGA